MDNLLTALPLVPAAVVIGIYLVKRSVQAREELLSESSGKSGASVPGHPSGHCAGG